MFIFMFLMLFGKLNSLLSTKFTYVKLIYLFFHSVLLIFSLLMFKYLEDNKILCNSSIFIYSCDVQSFFIPGSEIKLFIVQQTILIHV